MPDAAIQHAALVLAVAAVAVAALLGSTSTQIGGLVGVAVRLCRLRLRQEPDAQTFVHLAVVLPRAAATRLSRSTTTGPLGRCRY